MAHIPKVVVVGAGFGGLHIAKALRKAPVAVLMLDKSNYHLFQPLLYQVGTAGLAPNEIVYPVRAIFRNQKNFRFQLTEVTGANFETKEVYTSTGTIGYDYLLMAMGGETNFFGLSSVAENGFGLKDLDDAMALRNHILKMFELSVQLSDPDRIKALLTFVVAGGGPTGIELAGSLAELMRQMLVKDFPDLKPDAVSVIVLEAMDRILPGFPEDLAEKACQRLAEKQVEVRFHAAVEGFNGKQVRLKSGETIPACTLVWAAGIRAVSLLDQLDLQQNRQGRVVVEPTMQVPGHPDVFVVGDAAYLEHDGEPLPMVAPVAIQQGKLAARNILHHIRGESLENFEYRDPGSLATIGRNAAVARVKGLKFEGFFAWIVWLGVHLLWLIGFRNRLLVMINWAWDYFLFERAVRLILPDGRKETEDKPWTAELEYLSPPAEKQGQVHT